MKRLIVGLVVMLSVAAVARADVVLWDDEQITVSSAMTETLVLYNTSHASIVPGGSVPSLYANDASTIDVLGGSLGWPAYAYNQSTVTLSSGTMASLFLYNSSKVDVLGGTVTGYLRPYGESTVKISGGSVEYVELEDSSTASISGGSTFILNAHDSNVLDMTGGSVGLLQILGDTTLDVSGGTIDNALHTYSSSVATFHVKDFRLGGGLTLNGNRVLGTGTLSGEWVDGSPRWVVDIARNDGAGIFISLVAPGDANMDGVVDEADAATLAGHWGQSGGWREGDLNGDGLIGASDAAILAANWGHQAEEACSASVPEPLSGALLSAGVVVLLLWTPRRKQAYRTGGTSSRS